MGGYLASWGNLSLASRLLGAGPITPAGWLLRDDIAMNRIRAEGLPGFSALASSFRLRLAHCGYGRGTLYWVHLRRGSTLSARGFCLLMIFAYASIVFLRCFAYGYRFIKASTRHWPCFMDPCGCAWPEIWLMES